MLDARVGAGGVVRMVVALPLSKWELVEQGLLVRVAEAIERSLAQAEGGDCVGVAVSLEELADKPADFKGGGARARIRARCAEYHVASPCPRGRQGSLLIILIRGGFVGAYSTS